MDEDLQSLLDELSKIFEAHCEHEESAPRALYALGYFAGSIIAHAPNMSTRAYGQEVFMKGVADAAMVGSVRLQ